MRRDAPIIFKFSRVSRRADIPSSSRPRGTTNTPRLRPVRTVSPRGPPRSFGIVGSVRSAVSPDGGSDAHLLGRPRGPATRRPTPADAHEGVEDGPRPCFRPRVSPGVSLPRETWSPAVFRVSVPSRRASRSTGRAAELRVSGRRLRKMKSSRLGFSVDPPRNLSGESPTDGTPESA